jgi:hypothetical protein
MSIYIWAPEPAAGVMSRRRMYGPTRTPRVNVAARPDHSDHAPLAHTLKGQQSIAQDPSDRGEVHGIRSGCRAEGDGEGLVEQDLADSDEKGT